MELKRKGLVSFPFALKSPNKFERKLAFQRNYAVNIENSFSYANDANRRQNLIETEHEENISWKFI